MFSERLKKARKAKKLTQEQLAAVIMVERSSVGKYESTNVIPSPEVLKRIADALDVSIDYLLGRDNSPSPRRELYDLIENMDESEIAELENYVDFILSKKKK